MSIQLVKSGCSTALLVDDLLNQAIQLALLSVNAGSRRVYMHTYEQWLRWCNNSCIKPTHLSPIGVRDFLASLSVTRKTRQRQLSALRKLARVLALDDGFPQFRRNYDGLSLIKVPTEGTGGTERIRRALNAQEVWRVLEVWSRDALIDIRNRAILAVMFYTGLRRAEVTSLCWDDINLDAGIIVVRHGKGDKRREVAIVEDSRDSAVERLLDWKTALFEATNGKPRSYVFCPIGKSGKPGADKPIINRAVNQIVDQSCARSGVTFTPHDARRTLGTDLLANGHPIADVQEQLGHAHASTTLQGYALPANARKRRAHFKTSY